MPALSAEVNVRVNSARKSQNCSIAHWLQRYQEDPTDAVAAAVNAGMDSDLQGSEASLPGYLRVKPHAGVDSSGRGVFAGIDIAGHVPIIMCTGRIEQRNTSKHGRYSFEMEGAGQGAGQTFVGLDLNTGISGNLTKYINSSVGSGKPPNCQVYWQGSLAIVCSTQNIKKGEELLLQYTWVAEQPQVAGSTTTAAVNAARSEGNASNTPGRDTRSKRRQEAMLRNSSGSDTSAAPAAPLSPEGRSSAHAATEETSPSSSKRRRSVQQSPSATKNGTTANAAAAASAGPAAGSPWTRRRHKQ